jgi:hypothetical protein
MALLDMFPQVLSAEHGDRDFHDLAGEWRTRSDDIQNTVEQAVCEELMTLGTVGAESEPVGARFTS